MERIRQKRQIEKTRKNPKITGITGITGEVHSLPMHISSSKLLVIPVIPVIYT